MALPVLLLHGVRTSNSMWRAQVEALERAGHRALAIDLPGHGACRDEGFSLDGAVRAVRSGIDDLRADGTGGAGTARIPGRATGRGDGTVVVVGLSLGGYLALRAVSQDGRGVAGVAAAGCSTRPRGSVLRAWALAARGITAMPDGGVWLNQAMVDLMLGPQAAADVEAGGYALDVMDDMLAEMAACDPIADLRRIDVPVLLVNGQFDHFRGGERSYLRAGRDVRRKTIRGATHLVSLVRPVEFTRAVLEFAAALERAGTQERSTSRTATRP